MKLLFLLVLLTRNGAGDIHVAFVNTQTLDECQQKELLVKGIFMSADIPVLESRCSRSELRFSEFVHASTSRMAHHFYLIRFDSEAVRVQKMPDWRSCMRKQAEGAAQGRIYCGSSVQTLKQ